MSTVGASHIHDTSEPHSWRKHELSQIESVSDTPYKDVTRTRSKTLQNERVSEARRETYEAMERINQHYRSQSLSVSPGAKRRAMVLSSQASATKKPSSDDAEPVYVPSALDTVEIDRHMVGQGDLDKRRSASPDLSYYFEASATRKVNREEVNDESVFTICCIEQDDPESQDKRHTLPWLIPPKHKESDKSCTYDCTSRSPGTPMSTTYSLHRVNSRTDSASGKILPSIISGFSSSKRPFTEESNPSPVSSIFKHLLPRNLTSEGSDRSPADAPSISSAPDLDDLLTRNGTIRMTYQSGRMRDMESRRTVERSRLPASAAREPSVRSHSTRLLSEFIRSTGPDQHPQLTASSQPRGRKGPRFQARDAGYDKEENLHELAEFIRRGPPEDDIKKPAKASPVDIQKPRCCNTGPLEACLSSSAGESQASSMATRQSETDDTSAPSTPDKVVDTQFNDSKLGSITLSEFLRTMPAPEGGQCESGLLPEARHFQGFDGKPPSVRTMSTVQNQSRAASSGKTVSMKHSAASIGRNSIWSSPSAGGSEYLSVQGDPATRKAKKRLRKHKKPAEDPYRDSPYGDRDTPYGADLTRERRTKKFANLLRTRTDSPSLPIPSALSDGGPPNEGGLSARNGSSSFADSGRTSVMSGSWGGNTTSVQVMISGPDEAMKAKNGRSNGRLNDSFNSNGSKKQPRAITKFFKRAR
ncbi:hypothetical protein KEM56_002235 [Ascosphaera pollenicola]|nr:hypothetical protein KEM56_002235 [Ascosphaera pollenicola]